MSIKDNGGPAYPSSPSIGPNGDIYRPVDIGCEGVSMRDYFAAKAMQGLMGRSWDVDGVAPSNVFAMWAQSSYGMADAMLVARK